MKKYKEFRILSVDDVISLCIAKQWCTKGNNETYSAMLDKVWEFEDNEQCITADQLGEIAENIKANSDTSYNVENIMWELSKTANTSFSRY